MLYLKLPISFSSFSHLLIDMWLSGLRRCDRVVRFLVQTPTSCSAGLWEPNLVDRPPVMNAVINIG